MMETRRLVGYAGLLAGLLLGLTALLGACVASPSAGEARQKLTEEGGVRTRPATATLMPLESAPTRSPAPVKTVPPTLTVVADAEPPERSIRLTATVPPGVERVPAMTPSALIGEVPHDLMANLFDDVVARSEGEREAIEIVRAEAVVWRDGSLGCPQPGMMYTMALVAGYRVVLEVDGESYDYHANDGGYFFLCEGGAMDPMPTPSFLEEDVEMAPTASVSPGLQRFADQAVADLAERLNTEAEQIEVVEVKAVVWPDGSLGCPEPGVAYIQVQREGLLIRLRVGKRVYQYHSGGGSPPFLCEHPSLPEDVPSSPGLGID